MMKPILFNTEMVKAILEGRKTQTRRIVKPQPERFLTRDARNRIPMAAFIDNDKWVKSPYQPGDVLWVRETWLRGDDGYHYKANATNTSEELKKAYGYKWRPSIHMPRTAARIFLKVTDVRVERLNELTEDDAVAEGFKSGGIHEYWFKATYEFTKTWESIYGDWEVNPWVWVIEFERINKDG